MPANPFFLTNSFRFFSSLSPIRSAKKFQKGTLIPLTFFSPLSRSIPKSQIRPVPEGGGFGEGSGEAPRHAGEVGRMVAPAIRFFRYAYRNLSPARDIAALVFCFLFLLNLPS